MNGGRPAIERPTYLDGASGDQLKKAASDTAGACKQAASENAGLITATLLGVTAAYFVPKLFDWALPRIFGYADHQPDEFDLEVDR